MSKELKAKLQHDLQVIMSANKIVSPHGEVQIDMETTLHLFNALKPIVTRKIKQEIKERMQGNHPSASQLDIVDEIAAQAADGVVKSALGKIKKS